MTDTTKKTIPTYNDDIGRAYRSGYEKGKANEYVFSEEDVEKVARLGFHNSQWRISLFNKSGFTNQEAFLHKNRRLWRKLKKEGKLEFERYDEIYESYLKQARKCLAALHLKPEQIVKQQGRKEMADDIAKIAKYAPTAEIKEKTLQACKIAKSFEK